MDKRFETLNLSSILPNRFQPRLKFDDYKLNDLADSIRKYGVIEPIVVRPIGDKYEIIAGERRYKASVIAGKTDIPAIIVDMSDKDSEELALLENVQRQNLNPIEEAVSYKRILNMGYIDRDELARKIGKSPLEVAQKIKLLDLDDEVQDALLHGEISERHARSLMRIKNPDDQVSMLHRVIKERLTVKALDREINDLLNKPKVKTDSETESLFGNSEIKPINFDKIASEARDINVPKEKAPMADLMMKEDKRVMNDSLNQSPVNNENSGTNIFTQGLSYGETVNHVSSSTENPEYHVLGGNSIPDDNIISSNSGSVSSNINSGNVSPTFNSGISNGSVSSSMVDSNSFAGVNQNSNGFSQVNSGSYMNQGSVNPEPNMSQANINTSVGVQPNMGQANISPSVSTQPNVSPQPNINPSVSTQPNVNNFNDAINLIRQCAKQVESLGYSVDLRGMPVGNNYQLTFSLRKQ